MHGTSSSLHTWDDFTEIIKKNRRVVRFDLPGFGLTGPHPKNNYTYDYYVSFVNKMLEALKINYCYLAGNSLGGGITWKFALKYPDKVKKMILLDPDGVEIKLGKGAVGFMLAKTLGKIPLLKYIPYFSTPDWSIINSVQGVYYNKSKIKESTYQRYKDFTLRKGNRKALMLMLNNPIVDTSMYLKNIKTPTLIIWGDNDDVIPVEVAPKFQKEIPNSKLVIMKDMGHIPMEEDPEQTAKLIEDFIKE